MLSGNNNNGVRRITGGLMAAIVALGVLFGIVLAGGQSASAQDAPRYALGSLVATTTGLNLRDQPSASIGDKIAQLPVNARALVIGGPFNDNWYWLDFNGTKGYANGKYLVLVDENYTPVPDVTEVPTSAVQPTSPVPSPETTTVPPTQIPASSPTIDITTPSASGDYSGLWLGEMSVAGNVRVGPGLDQKILKGWWVGRRVLLYETATDKDGGEWYRVSETPEQPMWVHSSLVRKIEPVKFEGAKYKGRWISVNVSQQIMTAYQDGTPVKVSLTSTGTAKNPTEIGVWKIYYRLPKQDMDGGNLASGDYYNLKDVPFPQYFHISGEGLHGTYWHDNFGRPMSHGCVNLSTPIAEWLYGWARIGTVVWVHK
jgi:hypothetical protein